MLLTTIFGIDFSEVVREAILKIFAEPFQEMVDFFEILHEPYLLALEPEKYITGNGFDLAAMLSNIQTALLGFALGLMGLLFLKKGFETYVLWTEGDTDPGGLFIRFLQAGALAYCFATLYPYLIELTVEMTRSMNLTATGGGMIKETILWCLSSPSSLLHIIINVIVIFNALRLLFAFFKTGVELFLMRAGFPLACMGLLDADRSYFAEYIRTLSKTLLTVMVQAVCFSLGLSVIVHSRHQGDIVPIFFGIAMLAAGVKTPQLLIYHS